MKNHIGALETGSTVITRHADKGGWDINTDDLVNNLSAVDVNLVDGVLEYEFSQMLKDGKTPLKLEGIKRSLHLGEQIYANLPDRCVLVVVDSGVDRAALTSSLACEKIGYLEKFNKDETNKPLKNIDILKVDATEIMKQLAECNLESWQPFERMMQTDGISPQEAVFRWITFANDPNSQIAPEIHPHEGAERYRLLSKIINGDGSLIDSGSVPIVLFGVGHAFPLSQARYEKGSRSPEDLYTSFCQLHKYGPAGELEGVQKIEI